MMQYHHCDLHVHIGQSASGRAVKITASRDLTLPNIALECAQRKGITMVGVVDCASPPVIADIEALLEQGEVHQQEGGGLWHRAGVTIILGSEVETREPSGGISHHVSYFPNLERLKLFSDAIGRHVTNRELSSQACGLSARELARLCRDCGGTLMPAHCFTPHKSLYGSASRRATDLFGDEWAQIPAVELGLSADSELADHIAELADRTFLSNSDAHSLPRIGREYNTIRLASPTYDELMKALRREEGRQVVANFGLDPRLGKYHRTYCERCRWIARGEAPVDRCEQCGGDEVIQGVLDRILEIADYPAPRPPAHRPHYQHQVPLQFVPGVGAVAYNRLLNRFGTEMAVLHEADERGLAEAVGPKVARLIVLARTGELPLQAGGGGRYGRAVRGDPGAMRLPGL